MPNLKQPVEFILASASAARQRVLSDAGLKFKVDPSDVDENIIKSEGLRNGAIPAEIAMELACEKARNVSARHSDVIVVGADQTLDYQGQLYDKPVNIDAARKQLNELVGQTHTLHSALAVVRDGVVLWHHVEDAHLTMRKIDETFIDDYLAAVGPDVLTSVGCYHIEGLGAQLFERIDGDHFTILGLPLLPFLGFMRQAAFLA